MKTSPKLTNSVESILCVLNVLKAFRVPVTHVAYFRVQTAAQEPGKSTSRRCSMLSGWRLVRAILLMIYY